MTANELLAAVDAPPMPDFHVARHFDTWYVQPLTQEARLYLLDVAGECEIIAERVIVRHFDGLVAFLDGIFDVELRCV